MEAIKNGWFQEINEMWPGQFTSLQVKEVLHHEKSKYQDILVLETTNYGRALILDGIIQLTERDEFAYQEPLAFIPTCIHPHPSNVLVVGGGDGGIVRELDKNPHVKSIVLVEIDERVIECSKKYLPFLGKGFDSPKLTLKVCDGFEYMKQHKGEFDVIITDSSDPIGPAVNLFTVSYFQLLKGALKPNGIVCSQVGSLWLDIGLIRDMKEFCRDHFAKTAVAFSNVATYPTGQIAFLLASLDEKTVFEKPLHTFMEKELDEMNMKYYTSEWHTAAFTLPYYAKKELEENILK